MTTINIKQVLRSNTCGVYPELVKIAGAKGGVLLSLLLTWSGEENDGWVTKTDFEIFQATFMSASEMKSAKGCLQRLGLVELNKKASAYRIDFAVLAEVLERMEKR